MAEKKSKDSTQISGLFSISIEELNDNGLPGITQLISPGALKEKVQATERAAAALQAPKPPQLKGLAPSLKPPVSKYGKPQTDALPVHEISITNLEPSAIFESPAEQLPANHARNQAQATTAKEQAPPIRPISELTKLIQRPANLAAQAAQAQRPPSELTQLINSGNQKSGKPTAQPSTLTGPRTLTELGVQYELQFEMERGVYRYTRMKGHSRATFALWQQKFYFQMKLDLKALGLEAPFQEFQKSKDEFYSDAFGLIDANFVQIVRLETSAQKIYVFLSDQSLAPYQEILADLVQGKKPGNGSNDSGDDEFKIELVS